MFDVEEIKKLELKNVDTDIVVLTFDLNKYDIDTANDIYEMVKNQLPEEATLIGIPEGCQLAVQDIDYLINYLGGLRNGYLYRRQCSS